MKDRENSAIARAFIHETRSTLAQEQRRIHHSFQQLSDEQIWQRPAPDVNCAGTILLHLLGNLRQWFLRSNGGEDDTRDRPAEFAAAAPIPRQVLLADFDYLMARIEEVLQKVAPEVLLSIKRVQGVETTGLAAIYSTITHLEGHALQVAYIAHMFAGEGYEPFWKPANTAQGG